MTRISIIILSVALCIIIAVVLNLKSQRPGSSAEEPAQINITVNTVVNGKKFTLAVNKVTITTDDGDYNVEVEVDATQSALEVREKPKPKSRPPPRPAYRTERRGGRDGAPGSRIRSGGANAPPRGGE